MTLNFLLLLVGSLVHKVTSATYFVIPDDYSSHHSTDTDTHGLQHYLDNTSKYFVSNNWFHFMQGEYHINSDLVIKNVDNFTLMGPESGQCTISCTSFANVVVINASNIHFQNINLINCIKDHKEYFNTSYFDKYYARHSISFSKVTDYYTSLFLWNSSSVTIYNMNINVTINTSFIAILVVNANDVKMTDVKVQVNIFNCATFSNNLTEINGVKVFVHFYDRISEKGSLIIENFHYKNYRTCKNHLLCVIVIMYLQNDKHDTANGYRVELLNSDFSSLKNSSILCAYGGTLVKSMQGASKKSSRYIIITNSRFYNNSGNPNLSMFNIILGFIDSYFISHITVSKAQVYHYFIWFDECIFTRNTDISAVIYIRPPIAHTTVGYLTIIKSSFSDNKNVAFIKVVLKYQTIYYMIIYVSLTNVNVSSNEYYIDNNLILIANGLLQFRHVFFIQNICYDNIVYLQSSLLYIKRYNEISSNYARHIIKAQSNSFLFIHYLAIFNISHNVVFKVTKIVSNIEKYATPICPLQIYVGINHRNFYLDLLNCSLILSNNTEMISKILPNEIISYINNKCNWLGGTVFQKIEADVHMTYHKVISMSNTYGNTTTER